jgi:predicted metal-binding membrane protein
MEDTVNAGAWWQSETIGDVAHPVKHIVGTVEARRQLAGGHVGDDCCQALVQTQPHPVSHGELSEPVAAVVLGLYQFLGVKEMISDLHQERIPVQQLPVERLNTY